MLSFLRFVSCNSPRPGDLTNDEFDHVLVYSVGELACRINSGVDTTAIMGCGFEKVVNWQGVFDFVDHAAIWCETASTSHSSKGLELNREAKIALTLSRIDPSHEAYRGDGSDIPQKKHEVEGKNNRSYYEIPWWKERFGFLAFKIKGVYYNFFSAALDKISDTISIAYPRATDIESRSTATSCEWGPEWYDVYNKDSVKVTYLVDISSWSNGTNCYIEDPRSWISVTASAMILFSEDVDVDSWYSNYSTTYYPMLAPAEGCGLAEGPMRARGSTVRFERWAKGSSIVKKISKMLRAVFRGVSVQNSLIFISILSRVGHITGIM